MEPEGRGGEGGVIAPEGLPFLLGAAAVAAVLSLVWPRTVPAALFGVLLTVFMGWFFRNPDRTSPSLPGAWFSPSGPTVAGSPTSRLPGSSPGGSSAISPRGTPSGWASGSG